VAESSNAAMLVAIICNYTSLLTHSRSSHLGAVSASSCTKAPNHYLPLASCLRFNAHFGH